MAAPTLTQRITSAAVAITLLMCMSCSSSTTPRPVVIMQSARELVRILAKNGYACSPFIASARRVELLVKVDQGDCSLHREVMHIGVFVSKSDLHLELSRSKTAFCLQDAHGETDFAEGDYWIVSRADAATLQQMSRALGGTVRHVKC